MACECVSCSRERPILFSGPMVRAILEGRKTQTRRVMKPQPHPEFLARGVVGVVSQWPMQNGVRWFMRDGMSELVPCPYGNPGDRLWVREMLRHPDGDPWLYDADRQPVMASAEDETAMLVWGHHKEQDYCTSMFMPRWASRITLELTDVRVQRVQEISEEDARAEGVQEVTHANGVGRCWETYGAEFTSHSDSARSSFASIWESINGKRKATRSAA